MNPLFVFAFGFSSQPDAKTIENTLFDALVRIGAVSQDNADDPVKVGQYIDVEVPSLCGYTIASSGQNQPSCPYRCWCSRCWQSGLHEVNN